MAVPLDLFDFEAQSGTDTDTDRRDLYHQALVSLPHVNVNNLMNSI